MTETLNNYMRRPSMDRGSVLNETTPADRFAELRAAAGELEPTHIRVCRKCVRGFKARFIDEKICPTCNSAI